MMKQLIVAPLVVLLIAQTTGTRSDDGPPTEPSARTSESVSAEWPQWLGSPRRNNAPIGQGIPTHWEIGEFDYESGAWDPASAQNIRWVARLGSQTYGNAVVADGKIFVGTNNDAGWLDRYPKKVDLGCLLCFDVATGQFLWQHSSEKLPSGRVHDWEMVGICSAPLVEGKRLWFVTSRGEVRCLDTEGFHDHGENDGPYQDESHTGPREADVLWVFDMMRELGISQHNMCSCSVTAAGDILFVCTSNGVDESHVNLPAPNAPSFLALDKNTGKVLWHDASPGQNILHGQWSSPTYAVLGNVPQVIFAGGDGWVYSFDPHGNGTGGGKILWKFDCNPKDSLYDSSGNGTRNSLIATPVIHNGRVYIAVGDDPEYGEGLGHLWCIDPTKRGDVSPELVYNKADPSKPIPPKRTVAAEPEKGDFVRPNPDSAALWHYSQFDWNADGAIDEFHETMHRTCGAVAIRDGLLFVADITGLFHCLDANTGRAHWTYDMMASAWGAPLVVEDKVYIGDEEGDIAIFRLSADPKVAMKEEDGEKVPFHGEINMGNAVYSTPIVANHILYITTSTHLFAIGTSPEH